VTASAADPRSFDWDLLTRDFSAVAKEALEEFIGKDARHFDTQLAFPLGQIDEGRRIGEYLRTRQGGRLRILDVGSGNGGVAVSAACVGHEVHGLDIVPNRVFRLARGRVAASGKFRGQFQCIQTVASGDAIPYGTGSFDAVLCLETLEHVDDFAATGAEMMRVLKPGGVCMVTTPARVKSLFRRDPHYGIPGLLLLPDAVQRLLATTILRRVSPDLYDVTHTFWSLRGIGKLFPGTTTIEPLFNRPRQGIWLWRRFRSLLWDRIVITKASLS
jgi:2-polyprenyl-3-methyl-5-hydroxy-6-metoxy-1,4-benzoquinol methylase